VVPCSIVFCVATGIQPGNSAMALWFERLLAELGDELWVGDAARIRALAVRQQKTDARDA